MAPDPTPSAAHAGSEALVRKLLGGSRVFTLQMTVPQVLTIWVGKQAAGVSAWSWGAYLLSALLWFWFGLLKRDKNIYLPCIGWIVLDIGVIAGVLVYG